MWGGGGGDGFHVLIKIGLSKKVVLFTLEGFTDETSSILGVFPYTNNYFIVQ